MLPSRRAGFVVVAAVLAAILATANGELLCYSCVTQAGGDQTCVTNPAGVTTNTPVVKCKYKYCTIRRLEYTNDPGKIYSFLRGCEDEPLPEGENAGEDITVWSRKCNFADLCNVGDGLTEIVPGGGSSGGDGSDTIIVPGRGSAGSVYQRNHLTEILLYFVVLISIRQFL